MDNNDINDRICLWVKYLIKSGIYKSNAAFLREYGFAPGKLSEAKAGKSSFTAVDIRTILIKNPSLNADWVMTGRGEMLIDEHGNSYHPHDVSALLKMFTEERNRVEKLQAELRKVELENLELKHKLEIKTYPAILPEGR